MPYQNTILKNITGHVEKLDKTKKFAGLNIINVRHVEKHNNIICSKSGHVSVCLQIICQVLQLYNTSDSKLGLAYWDYTPNFTLCMNQHISVKFT